MYNCSIDLLIDTVSILKKKTNHFKAVEQIDVIILRWMGDVTAGVSDHMS